MGSSIWQLSVIPLGSAEPGEKRDVVVEAESWQAALRRGLDELGEDATLPEHSPPIVGAAGEISLVDAVRRRRLVLAPRDAGVGASTPSPPLRSAAQGRAHQTLPYSAERAAALQREFVLAKRAMPSPVPPPSVLERLARPELPIPAQPANAQGEPAPHPLEQEEPLITVLARRDVDPTPDSPLTYRERAYLLRSTGSPARLEHILMAELATLQRELEDRPRGKYVILALFDGPLVEGSEGTPLATLEWKDWRGPPRFSLGGSEAGLDPAEMEARLSAAFEAMAELHAASTPGKVLELGVSLIERLVPAEAISGCLYDLDADAFRFVAVTGPGADERRAGAVPVSGLFSAALASSGEVFLALEGSRDPRFDPGIDGRVGLVAEELAYVPLRRKQQLFGMLQLINRTPRGFSDADEAVLGYAGMQLTELLASRRGFAG